jgi:hypothetical protein
MRRMSVIIAFAAVFAATHTAADARDHRRHLSPDEDVAASQPCQCRAKGRIFIEGDETCINGDVLVCDMEQNVTTWRRTGKACPSS